MKILIAPNAFKGTIDAVSASQIIEDALRLNYPDASFQKMPIADGGDGTCQLLTKHLHLEEIKMMTLNPIGRPILGTFGFDRKNKTAYLDVSTVSGIQHLSDFEKLPGLTSTFGTGELIQKAIEIGCKHVVLGLGGSATIDLGLGILRALGFLFLDKNGREITIFSEGFISKIAHIQRPISQVNLSFTLLCDVYNYFFGTKGAIQTFGSQKGLKDYEFNSFSATCEHIWSTLEKKIGKKISDSESFGAAGGIAVGLSTFFPCEIKMGASYFFETVEMEKHIQNVDLVITGEGKYDEQSAGGKGSYELMKLIRKFNKKSILITGEISTPSHHFDQVLLLPPIDFTSQNVLSQAKQNLVKCIVDLEINHV